jgi:hypothetical protein
MNMIEKARQNRLSAIVNRLDRLDRAVAVPQFQSRRGAGRPDALG